MTSVGFGWPRISAGRDRGNPSTSEAERRLSPRLSEAGRNLTQRRGGGKGRKGGRPRDKGRTSLKELHRYILRPPEDAKCFSPGAGGIRGATCYKGLFAGHCCVF